MINMLKINKECIIKQYIKNNENTRKNRIITVKKLKHFYDRESKENIQDYVDIQYWY